MKLGIISRFFLPEGEENNKNNRESRILTFRG